MKRLIISLGMCLSIAMAAAGPAHAFRWRNYSNPSMCLGVTASNVTNGTAIITYQCDGTPNQNWNGSGTHWTNGANGDKCLTYNDWYHGHVVIWDCATANTQTTGGADWALEYAHVDIVGFDGTLDPCFHFKSTKYSSLNQVLGVAGGPQYVKNGGWTMLWEQSSGQSHDDQLWCLSSI